MTRVLSLCFAIVLIITSYSCSSDDTKSNTDDEPMADILINSEITNYTYTANDPKDDNWAIRYTISLDENKYSTGTKDFFVNDEPTSSTIGTAYLYNDAGFITNEISSTDDYSREYFYDSNNNLIAANQHLPGGAINYFRFISQSNNVYYHERLTLPHSDPATEIERRIIFKLSNQELITSAGRDTDLDGVLDHEHTFTYSAEGNLLSVSDANETITITYTDIIDTASYIQEQMFGRRNFSIIHAETFGRSSLTEIIKNSHSYHVSTTEEAMAEFEVNEDGFYTMKTYPENNQGNFIHVRSVTYNFE